MLFFDRTRIRVQTYCVEALYLVIYVAAFFRKSKQQ